MSFRADPGYGRTGHSSTASQPGSQCEYGVRFQVPPRGGSSLPLCVNSVDRVSKDGEYSAYKEMFLLVSSSQHKPNDMMHVLRSQGRQLKTKANEATTTYNLPAISQRATCK